MNYPKQNTFEYEFELSCRIGEGIFYEKVKAINYYDAVEIINILYPRIFIRRSKILNLHKQINELAFHDILNGKFGKSHKNNIVGIINDIIYERYYPLLHSTYISFSGFIHSYHSSKKELADILYGKDVFSKLCFEHEKDNESIHLYSCIKWFIEKSLDIEIEKIKPLKLKKVKYTYET